MMPYKLMRFIIGLVSIAFIGCSGGGGDSSSTTTPATTPAPAPTLEVFPADATFDFGTVTGANTVATLEVTIQNSGTADLSVSSISLSGQNPNDFLLNLDAGTTPCGQAPTVGPGASCNVTIDFQPQDVVIPPAGIDYSAVLTIQSNDTTWPTYEMGLSGKRQNVTEISVTINQIDACPRVVGSPVTAYVSVTDQGGFTVTTLDASNFTITEQTINKTATATFVDDTVTISVALLLDYSGSITDVPDNVKDMQNAVIDFVNDRLGANDEAEIIKFGTDIEVSQIFTSVKADLIGAIQSDTDLGRGTALYDAIVQAVTDIGGSTKDRKAIVVITDGVDIGAGGEQQSQNNLEDAIAAAIAAGAPVFTIGLGDTNTQVLTQIADQTGGTFYNSTTSDNLATVYQQLADLLFTDQYILTYDTSLASDAPGALEVTATSAPGNTDSDTVAINVCP